MPNQNTTQSVKISKSLQDIIRTVADDPSCTSLNSCMTRIEEKKCAAVEFYLRAAVQRLLIT